MFFHCDKCPRTIAEEGTVQHHDKDRSGENRFHCKDCQTTPLENRNLKTHRSDHFYVKKESELRSHGEGCLGIMEINN